MPRSGVQLEVLGLFRQLLRAVHAKGAETKSFGAQHVRKEFEQHRGVKKTNIQLIEHLIRAGRKQLARLSDPGTRLSAVPRQQ
jgi:succinate dehydrogenase assembly factor 1